MTLPILLVDDNPDACAMAAKLLWAWGYQADVAYDGPSALKLIDQKPYALAIIDYRLPATKSCTRPSKPASCGCCPSRSISRN
jgi:CheY-like chemotaxis protein